MTDNGIEQQMPSTVDSENLAGPPSAILSMIYFSIFVICIVKEVYPKIKKRLKDKHYRLRQLTLYSIMCITTFGKKKTKPNPISSSH